MKDKKFIVLTPFKMQVLQSFPFIDADFDALTNYELLCKVVEYLNITVDNINLLNEDFQTLYKYVHDYFDDLDVQEEINNKLDEMAESGELADIIAQYLGLAGVLAYNTVADLKEATNLVNGSTAKTLGYHTLNDGGMASYKIRTVTNEDTVDEKNIIALANNSLIAELITDKTINVKCIGAYGDGTHDDTANLQYAIDNYSEIYIPDGTYMVDAETSIIMKSNKKIVLSKQATLKAITNNLESYKIIKIDNVSNIYIDGGIIEGDRTTHVGSTGEWGLGISIMNNAKNITIKNIILKDCWGDGLYINGGENISTENIICDNNRRQGLSITNVKKYHSLNDKFINTNGTQPYSGVDIEPNYTTDILEDIVFDNPYTENNVGRGILVWLHNETETNIIINNHNDVGSKYGFGMGKSASTLGEVVLNNSTYIDNKESGIQLNNFFDSGCYLKINNPYISNCNTTDNTASYTAGISCYTESDTETPLGGFEVIEPFITMKEKSSSAKAIYVRDNQNHLVAKNVSIINPRNHQSNLRINLGDGIENFIFKDEKNMFQFNKNESLNIGLTNVYSNYINTAFESGRVITLPTGALLNYPYIFTRTNESKYMDIQFPTSQYCKYFDNSNTAPKIRLNFGDTVTLVRINTTDWIVTNIVGTPTLQ